MSNFKCQKCGTDIIDSPNGYITGCEHYPLKQELTPNEQHIKQLKRTIGVLLRQKTPLKETEKYINNAIDSFYSMLEVDENKYKKMWEKLKNIGVTLFTALDVSVEYDKGFNHAVKYYKAKIAEIETIEKEQGEHTP